MHVIEVSNLSKTFSRFALQDVSLAIRQGYITGLIGPNGAGKSTLIKLLMGMSLPDSGDIRLFGEPMPDTEAEAKHQIGFVSDESHYYEHLTVAAMKRIIAPWAACLPRIQRRGA